MSFLDLENEYRNMGYKIIAGIDEAGRGPLAGPVVAAAVVLPCDYVFDGINDSKKLTPSKRDSLFDVIQRDAVSIGVGTCSVEEIDEINILNATHKAMNKALENMTLNVSVNFALVDGLPVKNLVVPHMAVVKGDSKIISVAAASIIAKVTRDKIMIKLHEEFPEYNFAKHMGYGTKEHIEAIKKYGISKCHRLSFEPIKSMVKNDLHEKKEEKQWTLLDLY